MYVFFDDLLCAFDIHALLILQTYNSFKSYTVANSIILLSNTLSEYFNVNMGVKQGCIRSVILFTLYIYDLLSFLPGVEKLEISRVIADAIFIISDSAKTLQTIDNYWMNIACYGI